jgi:uncharacterized protein (DUF488 family)
MNTSYFSKSANHPNAASIAGKAPTWYHGREYKKLAPKYWFFQKYKEDNDWDYYKECYYKEVLDLLDPKQVYEELGEDAVILCWEGKDKNCHRHLVAKWLMDKLEVEIKEL